MSKLGQLHLMQTDVDRYAEWSRDVNPLHVSPSAGKESAFGANLAHGMLVLTEVTRGAELPAGKNLSRISAEFRGPVFPGNDYDIERENDGRLKVKNHGDVVLAANLEFEESADFSLKHEFGKVENRPEPLTAPAHRRLDDVNTGMGVAGTYRIPARTPTHPVLGANNERILALCSYLVGMEFPGLRSLFTRIDLQFAPQAKNAEELHYDAVISRVDKSFRIIDIDLQVTDEENNVLACGQLRSYFRFDSAALEANEMAQYMPVEATENLRGKLAFVTGGTRGLGRSISTALAVAGCKVVASYISNDRAAEEFSDSMQKDGFDVSCIRGDASDPSWCNSTFNKITAEHGALDILILNACSPPEVFKFGADSAGSFSEYIDTNFNLARSPLLAALPALRKSSGCVVNISSSFVTEQPAGFGPYVALKQNLEAFVASAADEFRDIHWYSPRPPRLQTTWNDTPTGAMNALPVEQVAIAIVSDLIEAPESGKVAGRTDFPELTRRAGSETRRIGIATTFTSEPLVEQFPAVGELLADTRYEIQQAPYGQLMQELVNPVSMLHATDLDCKLVFIRLADWLREKRHGSPERTGEAAFLEQMCGETIEAFRAFAERNSTPTIVLLCPSEDEIDELAQLYARLERNLHDEISVLTGIDVVLVEEAYHETYGIADKTGIFDSLRNEIAHVPYTSEYFSMLATAAAREIFHSYVPRKKVVVVDCDNTLWSGVVGEVGSQGVVFEQAHLALQRKLVSLMESGVLVCLCSKNEESDVWSVFEQRDDFLLKREHIVAAMINWQAKSQNMRTLAEKLNLGIDSFLFLDDNPVECAEVRARCPEVLTLQWPADEPTKCLALLRHTWEFDERGSTKEDAKRTEMYQQEFERQSAIDSSGDFAEFLAGLELNVDFRTLDEADLERASQLTLRTNQFNSTTIRRDESQVREISAADAGHVWTVRVSDKYGDYGLVGIIIGQQADGILHVDSFLLSCRVLGRGVEYEILSKLGEHALAEGLNEVWMHYVPSKKNEPLRAFFDSVAPDGIEALDDALEGIRFTSAEIAAICFEPEPSDTTEGKINGNLKEVVVSDRFDDPTAKIRSREEQIARSAERFSDDVQASQATKDYRGDIGQADELVVSSGEIEQFVVETFATELRRDAQEIIDIDNLDDLDCDSFKIVEITVAISGRFPDIPPTMLFEHKSVSEICNAIAAVQSDALSAESSAEVVPIARPAKQRDVAVVGIGVRAAEVESADELWQLLAAGESAVKPVPRRRTGFIGEMLDSRPHWAGLLESMEMFDSEFFGVAPKEAEYMDPQLRLLLEISWRALEDANAYADRALKNAGVFVGAMYNDYARYANIEHGQTSPIKCWEGFSLANRISQFFNFDGPSLTIDTACSSSGTALHYAFESINAGDCSAALVAGVNLIIDPARFAQLGRLGILSENGKCRPFGDEANGTVLGEGAGVVVLKALDEALAAGDKIYGVIKGTGVSVGAGSVGFTAPNPVAQSLAAKRCLRKSGLDPRTVGYIETHGTGTALGDPIEVRGLAMAYEDRNLWDSAENINASCGLGSIKPNLGHLEAGAGILGFIKLILQLHHGKLVPSLSSPAPNPAIDFENSAFYVQQELSEWEPMRLSGQQDAIPRRGALNSFGVGGSNAHVIVEEGAQSSNSQDNQTPAPNAGAGQLLVGSARSSAALGAVANGLSTAISALSGQDLATFVTNVSARDYQFDNRFAVFADDSLRISEALSEIAAGKKRGTNWRIGRISKSQPRLAFLFTGQGAQYSGMGKGLYARYSIFRETFDRCDELLSPMLGHSLKDLVFDGDGQTQSINDTGNTQPAIFALQVSLAALWRSWGVMPEYVLGHSVGEIAALTVAGGLSLEDGAKLIEARGRLMQSLPSGGAMMSVSAPEEYVANAISDYSQKVAIAALNGKEQTVISGDSATIDALDQQFQQAAIKTTKLTVSHAFHSPLMDPMLEPFSDVVSRINFKPAELKVVSGVTGRLLGDEFLSTDYWLKQVRQPVRFIDGIQSLLEHKISCAIEIGPHPVLTALAKNFASKTDIRWISSLRRDTNETESALAAVSEFWIGGNPINWEKLNGEASPGFELPPYPFQRKPYWLKDIGGLNIAGREQPGERIESYIVNWEQSGSDAGNVSLEGHWLLVSDAPEETLELFPSLRREVDSLQSVSFAEIISGRADDKLAGLNHVVVMSPHEYEPNAESSYGYAKNLVLAAALLLRKLKDKQSDIRWHFVTRDAVRLGNEQTNLVNLLGGVVWGLARSFMLEESASFSEIVDLSSTLSTELFENRLIHEWKATDGEEQIHHSGEGRYVARLDRQALDGRPETLDPDTTWLVTGSFGAIGRKFVRWLVGNGIKQLILTSRSGASGADAEALVKELGAQDVKVKVVVADVSRKADFSEIEDAANELSSAKFAVAHLAGIDIEISLRDLDEAQIDCVMAPKIQGACLLHELAIKKNASHFLTFGSISAIIGSPARSHYSAANGFLANLSAYRNGLGLAAHNVAWGPWAGGGMAGEAALAEMARVGNIGLDAEAALAELPMVLTSEYSDVTVASIDWSRLIPIYETRNKKAFFSRLKPETIGGTDATEISVASEIDVSYESVAAFLQKEICNLLGVAIEDLDLEQDFLELGMDSLMIVELSAQIEKSLAVGQIENIVDYPTVALLANRIIESIGTSVAGSSTAIRASAGDDFAQLPRHEQKEHLEHFLAMEVSGLLGFENPSEVDPEADLFEIGMDSLNAVELVTRISAEFGELDSANLLSEPMIAKIAEKLLDELNLSANYDSATASNAGSSEISVGNVDCENMSEPSREALLEFCNEAWPNREQSLVQARWDWMFEASAERLGREPEFWSESVDQNVAAFTGAIPVDLKSDKGDIPTAYLVDTMVLPEYRKYALGPRLISRITDNSRLWLSLGQSDAMRDILLRMNWTEVGQLNVYALPINSHNVLKAKYAAPVSLGLSAGISLVTGVRRVASLRGQKPVSVRRLERLDESLSEIAATAMSYFQTAVSRDISYLNWKYAEQPGQDYKIRSYHNNSGKPVGIAVFSVAEPGGNYQYRRATLCELLTDYSDSASFFAILNALRQECVELSVDAVHFPLIGKIIEESLVNYGFFKREPHRYLMIYQAGLSEIEKQAYRDDRRWLVTAGDADVDRPG